MSIYSLALFDPSKLNINIWAFQFVKSIANPALNTLFSTLSSSFLIVIPILVIYLYLKKDKNVYSFIIAGTVFFIVSDIIKMLTMEPRPCNVPQLSWINNLGCENTFSFPSNHASVLTGLIFFLKPYKYLRVLYFIWLALELFGRVYLGLHYFTDVIAGIALSIILYYVLSFYKPKINEMLNNIVKKIVPKLALK
ncbi:MAG: phosphatase PAP2 family protein [Candidatus Micrarchaeia archaeon]